MAEGLQKKLQQEVEKYKTVQRDYQKILSIRQQLDGQLNENNVVKEELDLLEPGANVFKLMGPVLVKHDLEEARQNVSKRIEYINSEMKRHDDNLKDLEKQQNALQDSLNKFQQQFQQAQMKAA
uniref:Probable prefoldin subunit 6 n=1 Tax=Strigamia maritima TaxID=126957 RepID=T1IUE9_STRMM